MGFNTNANSAKFDKRNKNSKVQNLHFAQKILTRVSPEKKFFCKNLVAIRDLKLVFYVSSEVRK